VAVVGRRSTIWCSGGSIDPPRLLPGTPRTGGPVGEILQGVDAGQEPGIEELTTLFSARGPEVTAVAEFADALRAEAVGDVVTFVKNRNINYTNICTFKCRFCGFAKGPLGLNLRGKPYLLDMDVIAERARAAWEAGATEVCLQGGIHPSSTGSTTWPSAGPSKQRPPTFHVHAFTASKSPKAPGASGNRSSSTSVDSRTPGSGRSPDGREILDDPVRRILCPDKVTTEQWLECHRAAHRVGSPPT